LKSIEFSLSREGFLLSALRVIAILSLLIGVVLALRAWSSGTGDFLAGAIFLVSMLSSAITCWALARILEDSENQRSTLHRMREELLREFMKPR
jgi:hypothetical protein